MFLICNGHMVNVDIDDKLYEKIKKLVLDDRLRYPSIKFFVQTTLLESVDGKLKSKEKSLLDKPFGKSSLEKTSEKTSLEGKEGSRKE